MGSVGSPKAREFSVSVRVRDVSDWTGVWTGPLVRLRIKSSVGLLEVGCSFTGGGFVSTNPSGRCVRRPGGTVGGARRFGSHAVIKVRPSTVC